MFAANEMQPYLTSTFYLNYGQHILIENFGLEPSLCQLLPISTRITHHTDLILIHHSTDQVVSTKFIWTHMDIHPWGIEISVQCPECHAIIFLCTMPSCSKSLHFKAPENKVSWNWLGPAITSGCWMAVNVTYMAWTCLYPILLLYNLPSLFQYIVSPHIWSQVYER